MNPTSQQQIITLARRVRTRWGIEYGIGFMLLMWVLVAFGVAVDLAIHIAKGAPLPLQRDLLWLVVIPLTSWTTIFRPRPLVEGARILDARLGLKQQFPTAVERALREVPPSDVEETCFTQAIDALQGRIWITPASVAQRFRRRAGLLGIAMLLCVVLGAWGAHLQKRLAPNSLVAMSAFERDALADAFAEAAANAEADQVRRLLESTVVAIETLDDEQLAEFLEELRKKGYDIVSLDAVHAREALGLPEPEPVFKGDDEAPSVDSATLPDVPAGATVFLPEDAQPSDAPLARVNDQVPFEDAWDHARRNAMRQLNQGDIAPEYRTLLRDYFATPR
jgi:hypothetical protein